MKNDPKRNQEGILCDKRMSLKLNGRFYKAFVRQYNMYGLEFLTSVNKIGQRVSVAEIRIVR